MRQEIYRLMHDKELPKFDQLDEHNFIWLPLESVPIDEHLPINSMRQPVLKVFNLLTWSAIGPFATDEQRFMRELALKHEEMGYFLIHYQGVFGIIGVDEYHDGWTPGRAVIFNSIETGFYYNRDKVTSPLMLELVYSKLKYPCKDFVYTPGKISNYDRIYYKSYNGPESLDD